MCKLKLGMIKRVSKCHKLIKLESKANQIAEYAHEEENQKKKLNRYLVQKVLEV